MKNLKMVLVLIALQSSFVVVSSVTAQVRPGKESIPSDVPASVRQGIEDLYSSDAVKRASAACSLGAQGTQASSAIPFLVAMLGDGSVIKPSQSCPTTPPFEDEAWAPDFEQIKESSPGEAATQALVAIGTPSITPLTAALKSGDWRARKNAAWALGHIGDSVAVDTLIGSLGDKAWQVRTQVAYSLSQRGGERAVDLLIAALQDESWQVRSMAALALGQKGGPSAIKPLNDALKDKNKHVRGYAKLALSMKRNER